MVNNSKPAIYTVPVKDKFLVYAPLKPVALIGNAALVNLLSVYLENSDVAADTTGIISLSGLLQPDRFNLTGCDCKNEYHPSTCIIMPTTGCNLACRYCYAAQDSGTVTMLNWNIAKKAIDISYENAMKYNKKFSLSFHGGGEPSMMPGLVARSAAYARSLDNQCPVSITTNGIWSEEFKESALPYFNEISLSLDGGSLTQDMQRPDRYGKGTYQRVMSTIREIDHLNIRFGIRMTVTRQSLGDLYSNVMYLCETTGCQSFQVEAVYNQGRAANTEMAISDINSFVTEFMKTYRAAERIGRSIRFSSVRPHVVTNSFCRATNDALIVTADGELTACYEVFNRTHEFSDDFIIGKMDPVNGIKLYPGARDSLLSKIAENRARCENCFCYYHCAGDCPPKALLSQKNGDYSRCEITRSITRELLIDKVITSDGIWRGDIRKTNRKIV